MKMSNWLLAISFTLLTFVIIGCSSEEATQTNDSNDQEETADTSTDEQETEETEQISGGELRVGTSAQPPTLDTHMATAISSYYITSQITVSK